MSCRRGLFIILFCLCAFGAFSQRNWQGNAAVARSGEFGSPGLYAASNAFPVNTKILVENVQTGQSVQLTVVQRIEGAGNIFVLVSAEAGKQIGLSGSQVIRVQAKVISPQNFDLSESLRDEAYSSDPDQNPPLSVTEEQLLPGPDTAAELRPEEVVEVAQAETVDREEPVTEIQGSTAEPAAAEEQLSETAGETGQSPDAEQLAEEPPAETAVEEAPEPAQPEAPAGPTQPQVAAGQTPEAKRLQELEDRIPQKQLYMPPRQQEIYALSPEADSAEGQEVAVEEPPAETVLEELPSEATEIEAEAEEVVEVEELPEEPAKEAPVEEGRPRVSMPGPTAEEKPLEVALPGPETVEPEKPSPEGTRLPEPQEESPLTMAPEEPPTDIEEVMAEEPEEIAEPAEAEPVEVAVAEASPRAEEQVVLSELLPSKSYFLQLGAYSTRSLAEKLAGDLTQSYSVTILPASSGGRQFFKVLVGPLNVDESGTLLYQFRSRGFKDAFLQYVE